MDAEPLILIVGDDMVAQRVCAELTATVGQRVCVLCSTEAERQAAFRRLGAGVEVLKADPDESLLAAGVREAASLLALSEDDGLNLSVALRGRSLNPNLRIVLRQLNVTLGRKIEQLVADCTVLSFAAHSAATYAACALDPGCFFALRFPESNGPLVGFGRHPAHELGIAGLTVGEAEGRLAARILALDSRRDPPSGAIVGAGDEVIVFRAVVERPGAVHRDRGERSAEERDADESRRHTPLLQRLLAAYQRANPILRTLAVAAAIFFSFSYCFFHFVLGKSWTAAAFYVVETMTNVGFGEVQVTTRGPVITAGAIAAMLGGIIFTSIFIGSVASALTRAQWIATQGLRRIRARRHVVICGGGKIGTAVLNLLTAAGKRVVVIDPAPDADLIRRARDRNVDLLTGDGAQDGALDLCDLANASAILALTNSDTTNLEIALGARVRSPDVPLVVRMENTGFALATAEIFGISTFSPAALTAPAFAGLSRFPGTRGRVRYAGDDHTIGQRVQGAVPERPAMTDCTPLGIWREGHVHLIRAFDEMKPFDVLLFAVPLGQFRSGDGAER